MKKKEMSYNEKVFTTWLDSYAEYLVETGEKNWSEGEALLAKAILRDIKHYSNLFLKGGK